MSEMSRLQHSNSVANENFKQNYLLSEDLLETGPQLVVESIDKSRSGPILGLFSKEQDDVSIDLGNKKKFEETKAPVLEVRKSNRLSCKDKRDVKDESAHNTL